MTDHHIITPHDRLRIAVHAHRSERTVRRVYAGTGTAYSRAAVARAARELGLASPPETTDDGTQAA